MAEAVVRRRFSVGYALAPKKQASFVQDSLVRTAAEKGVDLVQIDLEKALVDQGPFDCILHKLYSDEWRQQLKDFSVKNPSSLIIDPPEAIERLHNRISMLQVVTELEFGGGCGGGGDEEGSQSVISKSFFGIPKQIVIYDSESVSEINLQNEGLKFPVIAKPLVADGSAKSHKMMLVYNNDGLSKLKPPIVLQEFVNHGGVIFKVYVVGEHVTCVKRKSLPDVSEENLGSFEGPFSFSQVSNLNAEDRYDDKYYKMTLLENAELPPMSLITEIATGLRKATKLHLFNFDLIRDTNVGNKYLVIDINYFPGYAKMPNYESVVADFFWDVLSKIEQGFDRYMVDEGMRALYVGNREFADGEGDLPVSLLEREEKEHSLQV